MFPLDGQKGVMTSAQILYDDTCLVPPLVITNCMTNKHKRPLRNASRESWIYGLLVIIVELCKDSAVVTRWTQSLEHTFPYTGLFSQTINKYFPPLLSINITSCIPLLLQAPVWQMVLMLQPY